MQTPEGIVIVPTSYQDVVALLRSDALSAVEGPIASNLRLNVRGDHSSASAAYYQAEISVSGMTAGQIGAYLAENRDSLIGFGIRLPQFPGKPLSSGLSGVSQKPENPQARLVREGVGARVLRVAINALIAS